MWNAHICKAETWHLVDVIYTLCIHCLSGSKKETEIENTTLLRSSNYCSSEIEDTTVRACFDFRILAKTCLNEWMKGLRGLIGSLAPLIAI